VKAKSKVGVKKRNGKRNEKERERRSVFDGT
jgi:hypothetical protein